MGALLGGGEALPIDNAGMMSGSAPVAGSADMLGKLEANAGTLSGQGGMADAMAPESMGQVQGLLQSLNPVQKVGLQGLLGALNPTRSAPTPTGQPLPVAAAAPSALPQATPPSLPQMGGGGNYPGGGTTLGGGGTASGGVGAGAGRMMRQMQQSSRAPEQQQEPQPQTTSKMVPPVSQPPQMAYDWSGFRAQSRDAMQGMQQMPYVFSGYNQINGQNVSDIMKMFYPGWSPDPVAKPDPNADAPGQGSGEALPTWGF